MPLWTNWLGDHGVSAQRRSPQSLIELRSAIESAVRTGRCVRAVGSGHSHSEAAAPKSGAVFIDLGKLDRPLDLDANTLRGGSHAKALIRVEAGIRIQELNIKVLAPRGLGLLNQGNFDAQTVAGAVNTNTHGTGVEFGGFGDMVLSADIFVVVPNANHEPVVELWRVEPQGGITDPNSISALESAGIDRLVQQDDVFYSMIVSYGAMGIAYAYVLEVRDSYWLSEHTKQITVSEFRRSMRDVDGDGIPFAVGKYRHVWYVANALAAQDSRVSSLGSLSVHKIWMREVSRKDRNDYTDSLRVHPIWPPMRRRAGFRGLMQELAEKAPLLRRPTAQPGKRIFNSAVKSIANSLDKNLPKTLPFNHTGNRSAYYRVLRRSRDDSIRVNPYSDSMLDNTRIVGKPNPPTLAISTEFCANINQADKLINAVCKSIKDADYLAPGPVGIRFSAPSRHFLTHNAGRASVYMEVAGIIEAPPGTKPTGKLADLLIKTYSQEEKLAIQKEFLATAIDSVAADVPGVRVHLGKFHTWKRRDLIEHFEYAESWIRIQSFLNVFGTWSNKFTDTLGLHPATVPDARLWLTKELCSSDDVNRTVFAALAD